MPFAESLKKEVREKSNYRCCICEQVQIDLEVHHIIPESDGGPDTFDNAAPLCPNCHSNLGNDPLKRNRIKEKRDLWYTKCEVPNKMQDQLTQIWKFLNKRFGLEFKEEGEE